MLTKKIIADTYTLCMTSLMIFTIFNVTDYEKNIRLCCYINIAKSLNFYDCNYFDISHHLFAIILSLICLSFDLSNIDSYIFIGYQYLNKTNISTLFLTLRSIYQHIIIDLLFIFTFLYYRIDYNYHLYNGNLDKGFEILCDTTSQPFMCEKIVKSGFYLLSFLNIYWIYLVIVKIDKKYNIKKFFSTSLLLLMPYLFYHNLEITNLEYSLVPMYFVSTIFHDYDIRLGPNHPITCKWRNYDGCCIIILCMTTLTDDIYFSTLFGLLCMNSIFIKKFISIITNIYVALFIQNFYYKITFIICAILSITLFIYLDHYEIRWTHQSCFIWHLLNGINITIAKLFICDII